MKKKLVILLIFFLTIASFMHLVMMLDPPPGFVECWWRVAIGGVSALFASWLTLTEQYLSFYFRLLFGVINLIVFFADFWIAVFY